MDYGALIPLVAYFVAVQLTTRVSVNVLIPASIAVVLPYLMTLVVGYIFESSTGSPNIANLFSLASVLSVTIQFLLALYAFKQIRDQDGLTSTLLWSIGSFIVIVLGVPYIVGMSGI